MEVWFLPFDDADNRLRDAGGCESHAGRQEKLAARSGFILAEICGQTSSCQQWNVPELHKPRHRSCFLSEKSSINQQSLVIFSQITIISTSLS